jgi:hypothetical protein
MSEYLQPVPDNVVSLGSLALKPETLRNDRASLVAVNHEQDKYWLISKSGFNVKGEIDCLKRVYKDKLVSGMPEPWAIKDSLRELRGNAEGFEKEFLMQQPFLIIPLEIAGNRLVNSKSGLSIVDMISDKERFGAVKQVMVEVESQLTPSEYDLFKQRKTGEMDEKICVMTSPPGWTGFSDPSGGEINYDKAQTCIFRRLKDGSIEAYTVVTEMDEEENIKLLEGLGVKINLRDIKDPQQRLASIVENVAVFNPQYGEIHSIEDVVELMEQISQKKADTKSERFDQINQLLTNKQELSRVDENSEKLISQYEQFVVQNRQFLLDDECAAAFEKELGLTLLEMTRAVFLKKEPQHASSEKKLWVVTPERSSNKYEEEIAILAKLKGCSFSGIGGNKGGLAGLMESPLGLRSTIMEGFSSTKKKCDWCSKQKDNVVCGVCSDCASGEERKAA